jgi:hypothetical protein
MFSAPQEVELEHLQTEPAMVNRDVPAGTYQGLPATFANPQITIFNQTGSSPTVGSQTCAINQVCNITPTLNSMTVSVAQPTAPFPLTFTAHSPLGAAAALQCQRFDPDGFVRFAAHPDRARAFWSGCGSLNRSCRAPSALFCGRKTETGQDNSSRQSTRKLHDHR